MESENINLDELSPLLRELYHLIGFKATMKLVEIYGGRRIYLPTRKVEADHPLRQHLSEEAIATLQAHYPSGQLLSIPKADLLIRRTRDRLICRLYKSQSARELSERFNLAERSIWDIVARCKERGEF